MISIHALAGRATMGFTGLIQVIHISIHALAGRATNRI